MSKKASTLVGRLKIHRDGYGFLIPDDSHQADVFIPPRYIGLALPDDTVVISYQENDFQKRDGKVMEVLKRGHTHWIGSLEKKGKTFYAILPEYSQGIILDSHSVAHASAREGDLIQVLVTQYPTHEKPMKGKIEKVLGKLGDPKVEEEAIIVKHHLRRDFSGQVIKEISNFKEPDDSLVSKKRKDLRHFPFMTIDGINAKDFDDAVFLEKQGPFYFLYVSIADVSHYVSKNSFTDQEALLRGTSVYFPDWCIPMLPEVLSNGLCSLKPGVDRLTLTCQMQFNQQGVPLKAFYYPSLIKSQKRATYEEVQSYLNGDPNSQDDFPSEVKKSLDLMNELAGLLIKRRGERGSLDFELPEAQIIFDSQGKVQAIVKAKRFFSHQLIEEFMVAANQATACLLTQKKIPLLYRVHDKPDPFKLSEFMVLVQKLKLKNFLKQTNSPKDLSQFLKQVKKHPLEAFIHETLLRSMKQAIYDADNRGHYGLNLSCYSHFTSPIRRYPDLVVHRQLKKLCDQEANIELDFNPKKSWVPLHASKKGRFGKKGFYSYLDLEILGKNNSATERKAMEAEREMLSYKRTSFMKGHLHEEFYGTVKRVQKYGLSVELEPHYVHGFLHVSQLKDDYYWFDDKNMQLVSKKNQKKAYRVGDKIRVFVREVSSAERSIELGIVS